MSEQNIEQNSWALIGPGHVGRELIHQIGKDYVAERLQLQTQPMFVVGSSGIKTHDGLVHPDFDSLNDVDRLPEVT